MAIYQRGKNWYIDFTFHGQRIREMAGPSRKLAETVLAKRKTEIAENRFLDVRKELPPVKFYDFAREYLQWAKANKKPSSFIRDLFLMRQLNKEFETKNIHDITAWQVEKYKARRKEEIKPDSVNRGLALLKHMYTKAIERGKVKESPTKQVKLLKGAVMRVRFLMPGEIRVLLSNCAGHLKPIVTVALNTGMRKGGLLGLRWDQVNLEQGIISLLDTKNHERRDLPMNETVETTLRALKAEHQGEYIFCNECGERRDNVRRSFETALRRSGIEDFRFHDLRHTFASNLVMQGVDLMTIKELMGHKTLAMTLRYSQLAPGHKMKAVNILDQTLSLNPPQAERPAKVVSLTA